MFQSGFIYGFSMVIIMTTKGEKLIWLLVGLVAVAVTVSVAFALVFGSGYTSYGPYGMMDFAGGMFILMPLMAIIGTVLLIIFLYYLMEIMRPENVRENDYGTSSIEILRRRYARGEITQEEFEKMKKELQN